MCVWECASWPVKGFQHPWKDETSSDLGGTLSVGSVLVFVRFIAGRCAWACACAWPPRDSWDTNETFVTSVSTCILHHAKKVSIVRDGTVISRAHMSTWAYARMRCRSEAMLTQAWFCQLFSHPGESKIPARRVIKTPCGTAYSFTTTLHTHTHTENNGSNRFSSAAVVRTGVFATFASYIKRATGIPASSKLSARLSSSVTFPHSFCFSVSPLTLRAGFSFSFYCL